MQAKQINNPAAEADLEKRPAHFFVDGNQFLVDEFTIEKRSRKDRWDFFEKRNDPRNVAETEYVIMKKGKRVLARFDKVEFKRRVKAILKDQPVYQLIYPR